MQPGQYQLKPIGSISSPAGSSLCLNVEPPVGLRIPHIALRICNGTIEQTFNIVPRPLGSTLRNPDGSGVGSYTIRTADGSRCLHGARVLLIGPPSVDVSSCDFPPGANCDVTSSDQTWGLKAFNSLFAQIHYGGPPYGAGSDQIWAVRDDSIRSIRSIGTDLILYD